MRHETVRGVCIPVPESYADCIRLADSDYYRWFGKTSGSILRLWIARWRNPALGFMFYYRLCSRRGLLYPYFRLRLEKYIRKYGLQIPLAARVGYGLYLGHGIGVVVNSTAVIGSNVNLSQFSTIGSLRGNAGTIEDEAYLGPSVSLVEDVRVGRRSMVGAGAVVTRDVPAGASAAGVPAKVLNESSDYIPANLYPIPAQVCK